MVTPMCPSTLRLRGLLVAVCALLLVASGTAVAQDGNDPSTEQGTEEGAEDGTDQEGSSRSKKKPHKGTGAGGREPACVADPESGADNESDHDEPGKRRRAEARAEQDAGSDAPGEACTPPPRCDDGQVDLQPNAAQPNCVSGARLQQLLLEFEAAAAEETSALQELTVALEDLADLEDGLESMKVRLGGAQMRLASARADAGFAQLRESIAGEGLADVSDRLALEEDELRAQAVSAYVGGDRVELATSAALLELDNYADVETAREYAAAVMDDQFGTIEEVEGLRRAVEVLAEVVAEIESAAVQDAARVEDLERQLDDLVAEQRTLIGLAEDETVAIAERISRIQSRKSAYAEQLRVTGVGGGAIGETLRVRQADQEPPETTIGALAMPLENTRLGSPFGPRVHPIFSDPRLHTGIDMSGSAGDPILASADGLVVIAESTEGYGNVVVVDHGNTLATLYAHMSADAVSVGQQVTAGDLLGFVGSTGYSTGPHLHFEVRVKGQPVDPMSFLRFD